MLNLELFEKIKTQILANPENLDMTFYVHDTPCGTTYCIAGWAVHLSGYKINEKEETCETPKGDDTIESAAMELLGIPGEYTELFFHWRLPIDLKNEYYSTLDYPDRAKIVVRAIDRFIEGNGSFNAI